MLDYEHQDSTQTLTEGIAEYYDRNAHLSKLRGMSPEAQDFFRSHDVAHVVFGCNTTLPHEMVVKLSSIFGTTAGLSVLKGYALHESGEIYRGLAFTDIVRTFFRALIVVPRTIVQCHRQSGRWPWGEFQEYSETPLSSLRAKFGISVAVNVVGREDV